MCHLYTWYRFQPMESTYSNAVFIATVPEGCREGGHSNKEGPVTTGFLWIQLCWWPRSLLQPDPPWPAAGGHQPLQSAENCLRLSTGTRQGLTEPPAGLWSNLVSGAMKQKMEQQHNPSPLSQGDNNPQQGHSHSLNASCLSAVPVCLPPLSLTNMAFRWYKWFLFWRTERSQNKQARGWIERFPPGPVLVR